MRENRNFSDGSLERLYSVSMNCVMSPSNAVDLESPLHNFMCHCIAFKPSTLEVVKPEQNTLVMAIGPLQGSAR